MALFAKKQDKKGVAVPVKKAVEKKVSAAPASKASKEKRSSAVNGTATETLERVLVRPRITEKAAQATAHDVYTFEVAPFATKGQIKAAIVASYGVTPIKIAVVKTPGKRVSLRTRRGYGTKKAHKKAYIFLKKGDRIEFAS